MTRLRDLGEFEAIRRLIRAGAPPHEPDLDGVLVGPGDDAAVLRGEPGHDLVVTTDAFVAGRHWLDGWIEPHVLGMRLGRANLSDLAAMGARPRWATLAMGLAAGRDAVWAEAVERGVAQALAADGARLAGGNVVAVREEEWLCLTLIGETLPGRALLRSGAVAGDVLAVTGHPGRAGAAIALIRALGEEARGDEWAVLLDAWSAPASRVDLARALAASGAVRAAIDLSDGLAGDLAHLAEASGVGLEIDRAAWPADPPLEAAARRLGVEPWVLAAGASDDYELLLALDPARAALAAEVAREARVPLHVVGRATGTPGKIEVVAADGRREPLGVAGFDHFG